MRLAKPSNCEIWGHAKKIGVMVSKAVFTSASGTKIGLDENYKIAGVTSSHWSHILPFAHDHCPAASSVLVLQWLQNQRKPDPAFPLVHWFFSPEICAPFESENLIMVIFETCSFLSIFFLQLPFHFLNYPRRYYRALFTGSVWSWNLSLISLPHPREQSRMVIVGPLDVGGALCHPWSIILHLFGSFQCIIRVKYMDISKQMLHKGTKGPSKGEKELKPAKTEGVQGCVRVPYRLGHPWEFLL
ncbi:hypothetical protein C8J56DRAFT_896517 [Mycena floridula]|nr:hypothetical protein C8J56DRAFT_896517 [Mycena floridula]